LDTGSHFSYKKAGRAARSYAMMTATKWKTTATLASRSKQDSYYIYL
jgi:hypothetical protein